MGQALSTAVAHYHASARTSKSKQIHHQTSDNQTRMSSAAEPTTRCAVHSPALMKKSGAWESCWSSFHDAIVKGQLDACRQLLTSSRCVTPMCLGALSPAYRLRQLDSIAFSKLRTTALHMAALYRRPDFVQLLLEQGSEATAMDGFGRTPGAVLLEHWPRVSLSSATPAHHHHHLSPPPWDPRPGTPTPASARYPLPSHSPEHPHPHSDTLLQLWASQEEESSGEAQGTGMGRDRDTAGLFREQVMAWRARSARCLKLLLSYGLGVNEVADRRRASTLLHIAARYDLVDVIELILNADKKMEPGRAEAVVVVVEQKSPALILDRRCCSFHGKAEDEEGDKKKKHGSREETKKKKKEEEEEEVQKRSSKKKRSVSVPQQMKRAVVRRVRSAAVRSHSCVAHWVWNTTRRKNRLQCQQQQKQRQQHVSNADSGSRNQRLKRSGSALSLLESGRSCGPEGCSGRVAAEDVDLSQPVAAADLEVVNATAKTPLAVAVDRGSLNAAHCLLSHGADVFTSDFYGRTVLHFLSERDMTFDLLMREVVRLGVDVGRADNGGNTALHVASYMGNVGKVRLLLMVGASPDHGNLAGKTPLFLACQRRDPCAREILLLLMLGSVRVGVKDRLQRAPSLLQREENSAGFALLDRLHAASDTLLRRCVVRVRRSIGLSRLLDLSEPAPLPCPAFVRRAVFGEEERAIVNMLQI